MPYHSKKQLERLKAAVAHHYTQIETLRKSRESFLLAASGTLFPHSKGTEYPYHDILGLMRQAAESMSLTMAAQQPKVIVSPSKVAHIPFADHFKRAIEQYSRTMHLGEVLQDCVRNAFYMLGIAKVHMAEGEAVKIEADEWMDPGHPFVNSISISHFSYDTDATDFRLCSFVSDRYEVRFDDVVENQDYPAKLRKELKIMGPQGVNEAKREEWGDPLSGFASDEGRFYDMIYLADVFCPKEGIVYTVPVDSQYRFLTDPLKDLVWEGSETGPYFYLNLGPIPDKSTPSAPAQNLLLLHNLINTLYRKLRDQAERQKTIHVGPVGGEDDIRLWQETIDGDYFATNEPDSVKQVNIDGPNQANFAFALNAMQQFSKQAGNLEHQLGLSAQADTAAQEGMIGEGVSRMAAAQQARFHEYTSEVVKQLGRLLYQDQVTEVPMIQKVPGTDFSVDDTWQGGLQDDSRVGELIDYGIDIVAGSMEYKSLRQRLQDIDETWDRAIQLAPLAMQSGAFPNIQKYLELRAEYTATPEIMELWQFNQMPPQEQQGGSHERTLPPGQQGEYIHRSVPSGMSSGTEDAAVAQMMSSSENNRETF